MAKIILYAAVIPLVVWALECLRLDILFKKNKLISDELTKGSEYIAIRMPKNDSLIKLINKVNKSKWLDK